MKGLVALYGFGGGSGGSGAALTVNAPAGVTVTVSKDGKSKNKTANSSGIAVFKGLSTGEWTVTITDGEKTASKPVTIIADFNTKITFFSATIHVTYPAGSKCTATDGVTTLKAPDTSGTWDCVVPNAGTWTVSLDDGTQQQIVIETDGETKVLGTLYWDIVREGVCQDPYGLSNMTQNSDRITLISSAGKTALGYFTPKTKIGSRSLHYKISVVGGSTGTYMIGLSTVNTSEGNFTAYATANYPTSKDYREGDISLDGIGDSDEFYLAVCSKSGPQKTCTLNILELFFH